jgi:hypothetical protein
LYGCNGREGNKIVPEDIKQEVVSVQADQQEIILWDDGSIDVEHSIFQFSGDVKLSHVTFAPEQVRMLHQIVTNPVLFQALVTLLTGAAFASFRQP